MEKLLFCLTLICFAFSDGKGQSSMKSAVDTADFIEDFSNILYEEIGEQLLPTYGKLYNSDTGFVGLTLTVAQIKKDYTIGEVSFSNSMPMMFRSGIQSAMTKTLTSVKQKNKPIFIGTIVFPLYFMIARKKNYATPSSLSVLEGIYNKKYYLNCLIAPINKISYDQ